MTVTIYGIASCDTCRKARKALPDAAFRDIREEPLSAAERTAFLAAFGDGLINRASTTWRGLSETERAQGADALLDAYPTLMKRPVIVAGEALHLGWKQDVQSALGVA
ncbi:MAG: arsenate reductase family protein [Roseinatronobacter sp.]